MSALSLDYSEPAELYGGNAWRGHKTSLNYRRFPTAAEAIQYVVEELSGTSLYSCVIVVDEQRFNHLDIRQLYDASAFPLSRGRGKVANAS